MAPSRLLKLLALFCAASSTNAQNPETPAPVVSPTPAPGPTWSGCTDSSLPPLVTIGKKTTICLILANNLKWDDNNVRYLRMSFQPVADEFSRFIVPASYKDLVSQRSNINALGQMLNDNSDIAIHASSQQAVSYQKLYYHNAEEKIYPQLTAIIQVEEGVVREISWDDGCIFCKELECGRNTYGYDGQRASINTPTGGCGKTKSACDEGVDNPNPGCDISFHVVWTGTDANGTPFQSSAYRFSAFPKQDGLWEDQISLR